MRRIRVLIVDDAVVARRLLTEALGSDPHVEVVAAVPNGRVALARLGELDPDVVVLDVEMPELDGLATLAELRRLRPRLPVVMFSSLTERGAATTVEALARGASDYVAKPAGGGVGAALVRVREELLPKIRALVAPAAAAPAPPRARRTEAALIDVLAIGASTGGPTALATLLPELPASFPVPIVVVQHMPRLFTRRRAARRRLRRGRPRGAPHGGRARGRRGAHSHPRGAAGKLLPAVARRAPALGRPGLRAARARRRSHRDGARRAPRLRAGGRSGRADSRPGRSEQRGVGDARGGGGCGARRARAAARGDRARDRAPGFRRPGGGRVFEEVTDAGPRDRRLPGDPDADREHPQAGGLRGPR